VKRDLRLSSIEFVYEPNAVQEWVNVLIDLLKEELINSTNTSKEANSREEVLG
jgi:hypothetical protein